ncbi:MAG: DegV family protein [Oscillospiraceae bacterium]|nr:DegV family protein [Oscillospiraceae bacterium]
MIRILVDSASDVSHINSENITVVPLSVTINDKTYLDGVELGHDEFYEMLTATETFPKSSQPSPQSFAEAFEQAKEAGDELICILLSGGVSGTCQSARIAKELVEYDNIHIVDSLTGSYGVYLLVQQAQKMIQQGHTAQEIVAEIESLKERVMVYLSVDTLEYLYRGGRLSKTSALIGGVAKIKPVIYVTGEGKIGVFNKQIGISRAINALVDVAKNNPADTDHAFYTICTAGTHNIEMLESKLAENSVQVTQRIQMGPVVGTHAGPEAFGIIYIRK